MIRRPTRILAGCGLVTALALVTGLRGAGISGDLSALFRFFSQSTAPYTRPVPPHMTRLSLPPPGSEQLRAADWVTLVDRPWRQATTGWQVLADTDTPLKDYSFTWGPMAVAGQTFARGIATYPFSEIIYDLDGGAQRFRAQVGVTDDSKFAPSPSPLPPGGEGAGSVRFYVYGDEFLLFESGVVRAGERSRDVDLSVEGLGQLRLVVDDAGDGSLGDYALWGDPQLLTSDASPSSAAMEAIASARQERNAAAAASRHTEAALLKPRSQNGIALTRPRLDDSTAAVAAFDATSQTLAIANQQIVATLGYGGPRNGRLTVGRRSDELPTLLDVTPSFIREDGRAFRISELNPAPADTLAIRRLSPQPEIGSPDGGATIGARFRSPDGQEAVVLTLSVRDADAALELGVASESFNLRSVRYFDLVDGGLVLGDDVQFLTDRSHLYTGEARPDGHTRRAPVESTKPALIWSDTSGRGMLLALYDYVPSPAWLSLRRDPGLQTVAVGFELTATLQDFGPRGTAPPILSIELVDGPAGYTTFERFRRIVAARYPAMPLAAPPPHQWGSWYAFGPAVSAQLLRPQLDLLAANFGDIRTWQFVIDAGWHVQYGREDAELGTVDLEKFPGGVRAIADAVHARSMDLILYLGTGFVHDSAGNEGEWLGLRGLIERHPDWMIPFQRGDPEVHRYLLDYRNPAVRAYVEGVIKDFFNTHGADGILLDGLADAEGQLIPRAERDDPNGPPHPLLPTLDIYRLTRTAADRERPHAFVESGWLNPTAANPYAQIFRYGDEIDRVDSPYPFGGFLQKLDYAIFSRMALGQRSYVGTATGDPTRSETRWWLEAAAALGSHATLSLDLSRMNAETLAALRADLVALDPFNGTTAYGPGLFPETFATTRNGTTYLGVVNREPRARAMQVGLEPLGLNGMGPLTAFEPESGRSRRIDADFSVELGPKSFRLLVLRRDPGLVWSDSVVSPAATTSRGLSLDVRGPAQVPGATRLATPPPTGVWLDGMPLAAAPTGSSAGYVYDDTSGLLTVAYTHTDQRRIDVSW